MFVDSTFAIDKIRLDAQGPGQRFAVAGIEVCPRIKETNNEATTRWVPAHKGAEGNEKAGGLAKSAAEGGNPNGAVPDEYRWETSLSHMTRVATETKDRTAAQRISSHATPGLKYVEPTRWKGGQEKEASPSAKVCGGPILPAHVRNCGDRLRPEGQDTKGRRRQMLVVRERE